MPIHPDRAGRYPANWKDLRRQVLERAGHKCEQCGVQNHVYRSKISGQVSADPDALVAESNEITYIVLTIAHLEHDELETTDITRLRAWCQKCHLAYDHEHHMNNARITRKSRKAIGDLF